MGGYNLHVQDCDGHKIIYDGIEKNNYGAIKIGKHVWCCGHVDLLKGAEIGDNSIVAYGSMVSKSILESNVVIAGRPARVVKKNVSWNY